VAAMRRWGPWTQGQINKVRYDVRGYFRAYYAELRRLITEHDKNTEIPRWFRGGRKITTSCCADGVFIDHTPYDMTYPEREDSYEFLLPVDHGQMFLVGEMFDRSRTTMPDGRRMLAMLVYTPGEDFGTFVRLWPAHEGHPASDGYQLNVISEWTRLDAASMSNLGRWRDRSAARREAWEALRPYVEGGDVPVPS
jgi:hypothetical protein